MNGRIRLLVAASVAVVGAAGVVVGLRVGSSATRPAAASAARPAAASASAVPATVLPKVATYEAVDTATGDRVSLDDLRGRPALLAAWATWCVPCRTELPALQRLADERAADGLRVVLVNVDSAGTDDAKVTAWLRGRGITLTSWRDPDEHFGQTFVAPVLPASILLDAHGTVVGRWLGPLRTHDRAVVAALDRVTR